MFGNKLRNRRKELKMTLKEVAAKVGVAEATVQRWESENIKTITGDKLSKLSFALQIPTDTLCDWLSDSAPAVEADDFTEWDGKYNPNGKLAAEVNLYDSISSKYGENAAKSINSYFELHEEERKKLDSLLSDYCKLDEIDRAEVRGRVIQFIEDILKSEKYSAKEELSNKRVM